MSGHERLHAMDAVRAFALLAGVFLHCAMSFLPGFEVSGIPIIDNSPSVFLSAIFFVIHMFRMTLFFVIAGYFGRLLLERDGVRQFIRNRAWRILLPLVVFWLLNFPAIVVAFVWASFKLPGGYDPHLNEVQENPTLLQFPLTHLWFLYVLLLLYATALLVRLLLRATADRNGRASALIDRVLRILMNSPFATAVFATPLCVYLSLLRRWAPWFGIPTPDQSLIPNLSATIAFTTAFTLGWLIQRQSDLIKVWERRWAIHLILALAGTTGCLALTGVTPYYGPFNDPWTRATYAICYCVGLWEWTFAIFGIALRFHSGHSPLSRYLADSSYWVYLMHLPLVFLLQVAVQDLSLHWSLKFPFVLGMTMVLLLISYHWLVRPTFIGQWLNGRRYQSVVKGV